MVTELLYGDKEIRTLNGKQAIDTWSTYRCDLHSALIVAHKLSTQFAIPNLDKSFLTNGSFKFLPPTALDQFQFSAD